MEHRGLHVVRRAAARRAGAAPGVRLAECLARAVPPLLSGRARAHRLGCARDWPPGARRKQRAPLSGCHVGPSRSVCFILLRIRLQSAALIRNSLKYSL